jgi:L-threonylcarbamoyladenylate synthase
METLVLSTGEARAWEMAIDLLRQGQVIALPTDTVYGVAADGLNARAIEKLYDVKERPHDKAIPLLLADPDNLEQVALDAPDAARVLAAKFWPGALTLVIHARNNLPAVLRADGDSVAVRTPNHPVPRDLARALGHPLAATSANISGGRDPSTAQEVLAQLSGRLPLILDGGKVGGIPSTVVDFSVFPPCLMRQGALSLQDIERALGRKLDARRN